MTKLYRIIEYDGPQEWIDEILDRAIHGKMELAAGRCITAATIDPEDKVSITFARNKIRTLIAKIEHEDASIS